MTYAELLDAAVVVSANVERRGWEYSSTEYSGTTAHGQFLVRHEIFTRPGHPHAITVSANITTGRVTISALKNWLPR
jgi:hypothetical protein